MNKRNKTAAVCIPILLFIIHLGLELTSVLVTAIVILGLLEFYHLMDKGNYHYQRYSGLFAGIIICLGSYLKVKTGVELFGVIISMFLLMILIKSILNKDLFHMISYVSITVFSVLYIAWLFSHLILLRGISPYGESLVYLVLITTWLVDSAGYWVGRKYGKHKLAKYVSPNKSWEGTIAGLLTGIPVVFLCQKITGMSFLSGLNLGLQVLEPAHCILIGLLLGIGSQFGDLAESLIKRSVGVKDSGNIFPGHGGMMDRLDSLLFNVPILYYIMKLYLL